jgi:TDG/mug DNA glycosylase family protein
LRVLFVGINPSVRSAEVGQHVAGHGNRFWRLLHDAGLVPEPLGFADDVRLPDWGFGLTNVVARPTPSMADLAPSEFAAGAARLCRRVARLRPAVVAMVGVTVYRALYPEARGAVLLGEVVGEMAGADVVVVPNPSGRNAHYSYDAMRDAYARLAATIGSTRRTSSGGRTRR